MNGNGKKTVTAPQQRAGGTAKRGAEGSDSVKLTFGPAWDFDNSFGNRGRVEMLAAPAPRLDKVAVMNKREILPCFKICMCNIIYLHLHLLKGTEHGQRNFDNTHR